MWAKNERVFKALSFLQSCTCLKICIVQGTYYLFDFGFVSARAHLSFKSGISPTQAAASLV